jgi:hypothetical protein
MKGVAALVVAGMSVLILHPRASSADEYTLHRSLSSLQAGSFYKSQTVGDGVVQLTECQPFSAQNLKSLKAAFFCAPDRLGFRCSSDKSQDVIFVFHKDEDCRADRQHTLDAQ